jgi:undecaprenyl diphosphate synthase
MKFYGYEIDTGRLPLHIGIIMDGNGRWAKRRGLSRSEGHQAGFEALLKLIKANKKIGVKYISVYAFSTENHARPQEEVGFLMGLAVNTLKNYTEEFIKNDIRLLVTGSEEGLDKQLVSMIREAEKRTEICKSYVFNVAFNYGGRIEIVDAVKRIAQKVKTGEIEVSDIDKEAIKDYLYKPELPDVDLIIRTSGELRLSNFLLWQSAYSEFWFTKKFWPDFSPRDYFRAINDYQKRKRRFGKVL